MADPPPHAAPSLGNASPAPIPSLDHIPAVPSPLNPESSSKQKPPRPPVREREQREKKETLKKREASLVSKDVASTVPSKRKAASSHLPAAPSPMRYSIPPPRNSDYEAPRPSQFASHEPLPLLTPDGEIELKKPLDHAENKKGYRYTHCIADPLFRHKQYYRETDTLPYGARMSFEDADKWMHFCTDGKHVTNEKGWRMARANVCARAGSLYYEVRIVRGVPADHQPGDPTQAGPQPHVRVGWARREASLDAPVGFDGYSYGITDIRFETMHRSRSGKFFREKAPAAKKGARNEKEYIDLKDDVREGDVIGLEINLPSLSLHQKVVNGVYNPAVDLGDGFDDPATPIKNEPGTDVYDIIRDRIPVPYKGHVYFETMDYVSSKGMDAYADRTLSMSNLSASAASSAQGSPSTVVKTAPNPNHPDPSLRTLPHSSVRVYKNGQPVGTAFDHLLAFLPPASAPSKAADARQGFDDGMLGYYPAVACFSGGIAEVNFGANGFWMPPPHVRRGGGDARSTRAVADRWQEQIAEDVVWDVVDEVDFFMQDGGFGARVGDGELGLVQRSAAGLTNDEAD